jgi:hypothetical protein
MRLPGHTAHVRVLPLAFTLVLASCGSSPPPPPEAPRAPDPENQESASTPGVIDDGVRVGGDGALGTVDEAAVDRMLQPKLAEFGGCLNTHRRLGYVGGTITLKFRIARDGAVKRLGYLSDVGSFAVERCVLGIARGLRFPRPKGGEAEFEFPVSFRPKQEHRIWDGERIAQDVRRRARELRSCAGGPQSYALTFYIGAGGATTSVGFSSPEPWGAGMEAFAECIVNRARGWHFTDPLGEITKSTYTFE